MTSVNLAALADIADPAHLKLIVVLAAHFAKRERQAWPKLTTLAERAGMSRSTVQKALIEMEQLGYLERQKRFGTSTLYTIASRFFVAGGRSEKATTEGPNSGPKRERSLEASHSCPNVVPVEENASPNCKSEQGVSQRSALSAANSEQRENNRDAASSAGLAAAAHRDEHRAKRKNLLLTARRWVRY